MLISVLCTNDTMCTSQFSFVRALKEEYILGKKAREKAGARYLFVTWYSVNAKIISW